MAISVEDTYPGRSTPADASYPEGSIKNETIPGSSDDGTPLDQLWGNDFEGLKQAILRLSSQVPTAPGDVPDIATDSQILKGLVELASGRAINYDESGIVNAYVLDAQANQQAPLILFDGLKIRFTPSILNTGASTIKVAATAIKNLKTNDGNALPSGYLALVEWEAIYNLSADEFRLDRPVGGEYIKLSDVKASGTNGGTFTSGAWQTHILNTEDSDTGGNVTLAANQFTLNAGTYRMIALAIGYSVSSHKLKLRNISDASDELIGLTNYNQATEQNGSPSIVSGEFTITAAKTFQLQHRCSTTQTNTGFGLANAFGVSEVYAIVELWKVK